MNHVVDWDRISTGKTLDLNSKVSPPCGVKNADFGPPGKFPSGRLQSLLSGNRSPKWQEDDGLRPRCAVAHPKALVADGSVHTSRGLPEKLGWPLTETLTETVKQPLVALSLHGVSYVFVDFKTGAFSRSATSPKTHDRTGRFRPSVYPGLPCLGRIRNAPTRTPRAP